MKKYFKKAFLMVLGLSMAIGFGITHSRLVTSETEAVIGGGDIRIGVVRNSWWEDGSAVQVLRIADTAEILNNHTSASITFFTMESYTYDSYYDEGEEGVFDEYTTDGIIWYDVPLATIDGKYFDLARYDVPAYPDGEPWNRTSAEQYESGWNHMLWRIWGDGNGVTRPSGTEAESRNIDDETLVSLLYGYLTCSSSVDNGYGAYPSLRDNFDLEGRTIADSVVLIHDFDYDDDNYDYLTDDRIELNVKISDKIAYMKANYEASQNGGSVGNIGNLVNERYSLIALMALIVLGGGLTGYYFTISRKKIRI
jgi:hypothetical protein